MREFLCSMLGLFCLNGGELPPEEIVFNKADERLMVNEMLNINNDRELCLESLQPYLSEEETLQRCDELFPAPLSLEERFHKVAFQVRMPKTEELLPKHVVERAEEESPGFLEAVNKLQERHTQESITWLYSVMLEDLGQEKMEVYVETMERPEMLEASEIVMKRMPELFQRMMEEYIPEIVDLAVNWDLQ